MNREKYTRIDLATAANQSWHQDIVDTIRGWHSFSPEFTGAWPGDPEGSPAVSRYPNLVAELYAPGFHNYIGCVAKTARVRERTIASAIESGARLYPYQLERLAAALNVSVEYLSDPYLAIVDPSTDVGANQVARVCALLEETKGLDVPYIKRIRSGYESLSEGHKIVYASYRSYIRILLSVKRHPRLSRLRSEGKVLYIGYEPIGEAVQA